MPKAASTEGYDTLYRLGLVNRVVPREKVLEPAIALAEKISERSTFTVSRLKKMVNTQLSGQLATALQLEAEAAASAMGNEDTQQRIAGFTTGAEGDQCPGANGVLPQARPAPVGPKAAARTEPCAQVPGTPTPLRQLMVALAPG